jgi:hypothetical protein
MQLSDTHTPTDNTYITHLLLINTGIQVGIYICRISINMYITTYYCRLTSPPFPELQMWDRIHSKAAECRMKMNIYIH